MGAKKSWLGAAAVVLALAGCASEVGVSESSLENGGVCEPSHQTPLVDMETATIQAGVATITANESGVDIHLQADAGWALGDHYVAVGRDASSLTWFTLNPEPWVTGWVPSLDLHVDLAALGVACGEQVKVIIQGFARDPNGRVQLSALGDGSLAPWGWYDFYDVCCAPVDTGCTLTQGFWKTHPEAWPVTSLALGGRTYSASQLRAIMIAPSRRDASLILAQQLIAAELNRLTGATASPDLAAAHTWLAANGSAIPQAVHPSSVAGQQGVALANALAAYNEGRTGPGHCDAQ